MRSPGHLLLLASLVSACTLDAPVQYRVPDLRIIAIDAAVNDLTGNPTRTADVDPEDALLSETVVLTALVANPRNRATPTVSWFACAPPVEGSPCDPKQLRDLEAFSAPGAPGVYPLGVGETTSIDFASLPGDLQTGLGKWMAIYLGEATRTKPELSCNLFVEVPVIAIVRSAGVAEAALKRVRLEPSARLTNDYETNKNPSIADVRVNPSDADTCTGGFSLEATCASPADCGGGVCGGDGRCALPLGKATLCAKETTDSTQSFWNCTGAVRDEEQPIEELDWQWYVTAGEIAGTDFSGDATGRSIELTRPAGGFTLWVIARDGRGGTAWRELTFP